MKRQVSSLALNHYLPRILGDTCITETLSYIAISGLLISKIDFTRLAREGALIGVGPYKETLRASIINMRVLTRKVGKRYKNYWKLRS
jgi:hypothetical protein